MKRFRYYLLIPVTALLVLACSKKDEDPAPAVPTSTCFDPVVYTNQLPNLNFDEWGSSAESGGNYEEPCGYVWATGNPGTAIVSKITVSKVAGMNGIGYAAKMETVNAFNLLSAGSIFAGKFKVNFNNPALSAKLGVPFTARPTAFTGYYKYTSVNSDSASIIVLLTKWNTSLSKRDTVGFVDLTERNTLSDFVKFDLPISYNFPNGQLTPDSVQVNFSSSKEGESFKGEIGSTLFVDNCAFVY